MKQRELREEIIRAKIRRIEDSVNFVKNNFPDKFKEFEGDRILHTGIYKEIEFAIQNILDICVVINSDLSLGSPETEDTILDHLEKSKTLDKKITDKIRLMKRFRNILIHRYGDIDDKKAFDSINEGFDDFEQIVNEIENFLKKNKKK